MDLLTGNIHVINGRGTAVVMYHYRIRQSGGTTSSEERQGKDEYYKKKTE